MSEYLVPILIGALVAGLIYRRLRRLFGRHKISITGFAIRIALTGLFAAVLVVLPGESLGVRLMGVVIGLVLAVIGVITTKIDQEGQDWFFSPNLYLGLVILSLFLGRIAYRILLVLKMSDADRGVTDLGQVFSGNPIGRILLMALLVYFAAYHAGVLAMRRPKIGAGAS